MSHAFTTGDLVRARGREWVVLPSSEPEVLRLRPLSGAESNVQVLHPALERRPVEPASFGLPLPAPATTQDGARLLSDAVRLSLRRGAGPFRSAARVAFEPRSYQLVPLLMALRLPIPRLLIADDVGVGKTIEAGLIARELYDRGELDRFTVICPPQLVDQWTAELRTLFDFDPVAVTAASASRLERGLPPSQTLFDAYPCTVVSLDYIKADKRRESFAQACPPLVIVDEAHTCVGGERGKHQRYELLQRLSEDMERRLLLLTATPHSGDEAAFDRLLGLLDPSLAGGAGFATDAGRIRLARHFVQRRRVDITGQEWNESRAFPKHETRDHPYRFDAAHQSFHDAVLDWCLGTVERAGGKARLAFWGVLALMRCVGSSPAAAISTLRNRMAADVDRLPDQVLDDDDDADAVDVAPSTDFGADADPALTSLLEQAEALAKAPDPKLNALAALLRPLLNGGANPVVFCRYLATADYVRDGLQRLFPKIRIEAITGALPPDDRRARVRAMGEVDETGDTPQRLLVATDCLSEGINLQLLFDTVVHYDLSWNPTRHQQREGRVDRFGQPATLVRTALMFSSDSAIDGAVLEVILRKANAIRERTGVSVPLPEERGAVSGALMNAVMLRRGRARQLSLDFGLDVDTASMETRWRDTEEGERRSRARFAQNAMRPDEVAPEWRRWRDVLGTPSEVKRFVERALQRLKAPLEPGHGGEMKLVVPLLPPALVERLGARGQRGIVRIAFERATTSARVVTRSHPVTAILADAVLEGALDPRSSPLPPLGRVGAWPTNAVQVVTTVVLLRLRFKLTPQARRGRLLLAEEAEAVALAPDGNLVTTGNAARALIEAQAASDLAELARERLVRLALARVEAAMAGPIADHARARAVSLAEDHDRVRSADGRRGAAMSVLVEPVLPADVVGLFVLVPAL
jgi:superfamily II DNA or RNA helicase